MNRAQDSLTSGGQLAQKSNDVESTLRIETRCRLIQEEKELRFGGKLNTDCDTFALFDGKTSLRIPKWLN